MFLKYYTKATSYLRLRTRLSNYLDRRPILVIHLLTNPRQVSQHCSRLDGGDLLRQRTISLRSITSMTPQEYLTLIDQASGLIIRTR